jgi:hypothetical protein
MRQRAVTPRREKIEQVLGRFRTGIPSGELDDEDWDSLRVAVRIVYETEELGASVGRTATAERGSAISDWSDSVEGALSFMIWIRELTSIVSGATYPANTPASVDALWQRHCILAGQLLSLTLTPAERMSVLLELGGIEVSLLGCMWALEPVLAEHAGQEKHDET